MFITHTIPDNTQINHSDAKEHFSLILFA